VLILDSCIIIPLGQSEEKKIAERLLGSQFISFLMNIASSAKHNQRRRCGGEVATSSDESLHHH
jgi:hypothetical protein